MNRYTYGLFAFFLISLPVVGQEKLTLSERPSTQSLESAKQLIKSAETAATKLAVAGYALIEIKLTGKLTHYPVPGSEDCITTILIPKGTIYQGWFSVNGELKWVKIEAADVDRLLVTGTKKGTATIIWMTVKGDEAVVVAAFQFDVAGGKPKPGPVIPDITDFEKKLKAAGDADIKAGKGSNEHALLLASVYRSAANALPATSTVGELYKQLQTAFTAAGVPPVAQSLPTMRRAIADELDKRLPTEADKQLTLEDRNRIAAAFTAMADALEAAFQ